MGKRNAVEIRRLLLEALKEEIHCGVISDGALQFSLKIDGEKAEK